MQCVSVVLDLVVCEIRVVVDIAQAVQVLHKDMLVLVLCKRDLRKRDGSLGR